MKVIKSFEKKGTFVKVTNNSERGYNVLGYDINPGETRWMPQPLTNHILTKPGLRISCEPTVMGDDIILESISVRAKETGSLIVMLSGAGWGSTGGGQRPQQLANEFAKISSVVHINPEWGTALSSYKCNGCVITNTNQWDYIKNIDARMKVMYCCGPWENFVDIFKEAHESGWITHYDIIDDWDHMPGLDHRIMGEKDVMERSDIITVSAKSLKKRAKGRNAVLVRNCTSVPLTVPLEDREFDAVYVGCLDAPWMDWDLIGHAAENFKLLIIGPRTNNVPNVRVTWAGVIDHSLLGSYLSKGKRGIIPFNKMKLVEGVDPLKAYDYLASGIEPVSTDMPELYNRPFMIVTKTKEEFMDAIERPLNVDPLDILKEARRHTARMRTDKIMQLYEREMKYDKF